MVASNPKKKRTYISKENPKDKRDNMTKSDDSSSGAEATSSNELIERHIGETLLTGVGCPPKPTTPLLKGKDLVALYFSASWSHSCKPFTAKLIEFYNKVAKQNGMEIIFVSSDNDRKSFEEYFETMPWLAMDGDEKGTSLKHALATNLKAFRLPTLVILNVQTGNFVTDQARKEILALSEPTKGEDGKETTLSDKEYVEKGKALVHSWKERDPTPIGQGTLSSSAVDSMQSTINYFVQNPLFAVLLICLLAFTPIIQRVMDNPLLGVAFWIIFKNFGREKLARNEPYVVQEPRTAEKDKSQ